MVSAEFEAELNAAFWLCDDNDTCTYCGQPEHECDCNRTMNDQLADYDQIVGNV